MLAAISEFFKRLLSVDMKENTVHEITLWDISGATLRQLIEFYYIGGIQLSAGNAQHIRAQANRYGLVRLAQKCEQYLALEKTPSMSMGNRCPALAPAESHIDVEMETTESNHILEHFMEFVETDDFDHLQVDALINFLKSDNLVVGSEEDVFKIIVIWIRLDHCSRLPHLQRLTETLRLPQIEIDVSNCIEPSTDKRDRR